MIRYPLISIFLCSPVPDGGAVCSWRILCLRIPPDCSVRPWPEPGYFPGHSSGITTFTRRLRDLDITGMQRVVYAEPVHELPSFLPPVQSRVDVHGDTARQPEPVGTAGEGPVPSVQGQGGNGPEECPVGAGKGIPQGVPRGIHVTDRRKPPAGYPSFHS